MIISIRVLMLGVSLVATSATAVAAKADFKQSPPASSRPDCAAMKNMDMSKTDPVVAGALHKKCPRGAVVNLDRPSQDGKTSVPSAATKPDEQGAK